MKDDTDTPVEAYVITPEQLRARDERIIRAALAWWDADSSYGCDEAYEDDDTAADWIIAQADGVDQ